MKAVELETVIGDHLPVCTISIDSQFPDYYSVQFMASGSLKFQREGHASIETESPLFFWTDRRSSYRYGPGKTGTWDHRWIVIQGQLTDAYCLPMLEDLAPQGYTPVTNPLHVIKAFDDLLELMKNTKDPLAHMHALHRILARVDRGRARLEIEPRLQEIKNQIDAAPETAFNFESLAQNNGYSYTSFRRLFQKLFGKAPYAYLTERRMQDAASRLVRTSERIQSIGYFYGFQEAASFSKAFKQYHGLSPRTYRDTFGIYRTS